MAKKFIRILAVGLALIMCLAMTVPAFAAEGDVVSTSGKVYFDKDLVMPKDATVPDVKFDFKLEANNRGNGIHVEGWEVHTGIFNLKVEETEPAPEPPAQEEAETTLKTEYSVSFDATHPTTPGSDRQGAIADKDHKYATESFYVDFNNVDWPEPGIYRYMIKETVEERDKVGGITYTEKVFYIDVYIVSDDDGNLSVGNTVVTEDDFLEPDPEKKGTEGDEDTNNDGVVDEPTLPKKEDGTKIDASGPKEPEEPGKEPQEPEEGKTNPEDKLPNEPADPEDPNDTKDNGGINKGESQADFINNYQPLKLVLSKTVRGNQGSRVAYFQFDIEVSGLDDGVYKIVGNNDQGDDGYIVVRSGKGTVTVNLKNNQKITILVPYGTGYTITEDADAASASEYKTSTDSQAAEKTFDWSGITTGAEEDKTVTASNMANDATVAFVNYQEGTIPTGILMTVAPFAALMGVGLVGGAVVLKKKRED